MLVLPFIVPPATEQAAPLIPATSGVCRDSSGRVRLKCLAPGVVVKLDGPGATAEPRERQPSRPARKAGRKPR